MLGMTIGGIDLSGFEVPGELAGVGGTQLIVKKEFPGGFITEQELGAFPADVTWSGYLTGASAFGRQQAIDAMRAAGNDIQVVYGPYAWTGKIESFTSKIKHQYLVEYEMKFSPSQDLSAASQISGSVLGVDPLLSISLGSLSDIEAGDTGLSMPASLISYTDALSTNVSSGLLAGNGLIGGLSPDALTLIQQSAASLQAAATPLIAGMDATVASPALDASAYAGNISTLVGSALAPLLEFTALNPNLYQLSQEYFGDVSRWQDIATASDITDPQPVGKFTIKIPAI